MYNTMIGCGGMMVHSFNAEHKRPADAAAGAHRAPVHPTISRTTKSAPVEALHEHGTKKSFLRRNLCPPVSDDPQHQNSFTVRVSLWAGSSQPITAMLYLSQDRSRVGTTGRHIYCTAARFVLPVRRENTAARAYSKAKTLTRRACSSSPHLA